MSSWDKLLQDASPRGHLVQLYKSDECLLTKNVSDYIRIGLSRGEGLLVVATREHNQQTALRLQDDGIDMAAAVRDGRLVALDAHEALDQCMANGRPDWARFDSSIGELVRQIARHPDHTGLRVHGEIVGILWNSGRDEAAIQLERFWNKLLASQPFSLFCAYPIDVFDNEFQITTLDALLCEHTHLLPTGARGNLETAINRAMEEVLGPKVDDLRLLIKANYRPSWAVLPRAEAIVLWIRNNLPNEAEAILSRAREHYRPSPPTQSRTQSDPKTMRADSGGNRALD